jgi:hypothetical protein
MGKRKFQDSSADDLPVSTHLPCQLVSITRHEPSEANLAKFPDMKPSLCFRFMLFNPDDRELHGATAVRFVTDSMSKLGKLFEFVTDLRDGHPPDEFDEDDYVGEWYRITVRKKPGSEKLTVTTASPCDGPHVKSVPVDWNTVEAIKETRAKAAKRSRKAAKMVEQEIEAAAVAGEDDEIPF